MPDFKFRAQAALDLRRTQEDEAAAALARVEAAYHAAQAAETGAMTDRQSACDTLQAAERSGIGAGALEWHWNWIHRLSGEIGRRRRELESCRAAVTAAERAWHDARRRRLVLERLRERAVRRHQQAESRRELKAVDELARLRFVMPDAATGGKHRDD